MRKPDDNQTGKIDSERQQRTQKERSEQALSNLGSQDRKRTPTTPPERIPPRGRDDPGP